QAEDGIRDDLVTGVQTCALPICSLAGLRSALGSRDEALSLYRRALEAQERLVKEDPVNLRYQQELAATCRQLGGELCARGTAPQIGRASCRERGSSWVGCGAVEE